MHKLRLRKSGPEAAWLRCLYETRQTSAWTEERNEASTYDRGGGRRGVIVSRVLLVGESWFHYSVEVKGFDSYTHGGYEVGTEWLATALAQGGHDFVHLPSHLVATEWPHDLNAFDLVLLSDVGENTLLLTPETFTKGERRANPLVVIVDYVRAGGAFGMIGGYLSFGGFDGRAHYASSPIEAVLPVVILPFDDRVELPEGTDPIIDLAGHPALGGATTLGPLLGYNRLTPRTDAKVVARCGNDPLLVVWTCGNGRAFAYASDCGPHWAAPLYLASSDYARLWNGIVAWATNERAASCGRHDRTDAKRLQHAAPSRRRELQRIAHRVQR